MIISKVISGLGNQLFQYALGRQISIEKNTPLKLDTTFFNSQDLRSYKLNNYNINADIASSEEINYFLYKYNTNMLSSRVLRKTEKLLPRTKRKLFKEEVPWQYEPELFKVSSNIYIDGYWQHYKYFENIDPLIFKELTIKSPYTDFVQSTIQHIIGNENSVSIHIRRGDYITDKQANNLMGVLPLNYYYSAIDIIKQRILNPTFYIFSDDLEWVKNNLSISSPCRYIDGGKDYFDLDLMSKCKHNIIANSSFSWWGAFLNKNINKIVIAPKQWVLPESINKNIELIFPSWTKI